MKEIEIKAKLVDRKSVVHKLEALGCVFEPTVTQEDTVYVKNSFESIETFKANGIFLRLRVRSDGVVLFTVKQRMENDLEAIEHETQIESREEMEKALTLMGYKKAIRVKKSRVVTHYNGCEICLDEVEDLGNFIEMEKLVEDGDAKHIQEELFSFFESIGINREDHVLVGYDILTLQKNENA